MYNKKIVKICVIIIITLCVSLAVTFAIAPIHDRLEYTSGNFIVDDDTGYTTHFQGWPLEFMRFNTFLSVGTPMRSDNWIDTANLAIDTSVFLIPSFLIVILVSNTINKRKNLLHKNYSLRKKKSSKLID